MTNLKSSGVNQILIREEDIQNTIAEIAAELDEQCRGETPLLVGVLTGAVTFMADLMRAMTSHVQIDFMAVSSYGDETSSSGVVRILKDLNQDIGGRHVIVVEDIVDSGLTLQYLLDHLRRREPSRITVVALLKKDKADAIEVQVDRVGFVIPDEFVVGYGLDYAGRFRNLPYIGILDSAEISELYSKMLQFRLVPRIGVALFDSVNPQPEEHPMGDLRRLRSSTIWLVLIVAVIALWFLVVDNDESTTSKDFSTVAQEISDGTSAIAVDE